MEELLKTNESEVDTTENVVEPTDELAENHESETEPVEDTENPTQSEKKSAKEDKLSAYEQIILAEMQRRASEGDTLLADALKNKDKDIHKCFGYVKSQAQKQAVKGCAMIEDSVVYGWAHHYYIETKEVIDAETKPKSTPKPTLNAEVKADTKPTAPAKPTKKATYNDNPLLKAVSKKAKKANKETETKTKTNDKVYKKKANGKIFTITEFSLF